MRETLSLPSIRRYPQIHFDPLLHRLTQLLVAKPGTEKLICTLFVQILRPNQRALCIVRSFPFFPDSQAVANWVAAGQGDHEAHSMMTMHATSSTTSYHSNS